MQSVGKAHHQWHVAVELVLCATWVACYGSLSIALEAHLRVLLVQLFQQSSCKRVHHHA